MRDTKPRRTLLSLSIVELMMAGVKTAIGHHSPSSAPTPAKGVPANQAAPPRVWDSSSRRGSGMERSVSRRGGRGAWARPEPRCPQGSACAPHRPRAHRVVTRGLWHWTRAAELRAERVPRGAGGPRARIVA